MRWILFAFLLCASCGRADAALALVSASGSDGLGDYQEQAFTLTEPSRVAVTWSANLDSDWWLTDEGPFVLPAVRYHWQLGTTWYAISLFDGQSFTEVAIELVEPQEFFAATPTPAPSDVTSAKNGTLYFVLPAGDYLLNIGGGTTDVPTTSAWNATAEVNLVPIPEPASWALAASGILACGLATRLKQTRGTTPRA